MMMQLKNIKERKKDLFSKRSIYINMNSLKGAMDRQAMDLIVEKIETEEMLVELLDLKIDFGQGYLFGEPKAVKK